VARSHDRVTASAEGLGFDGETFVRQPGSQKAGRRRGPSWLDVSWLRLRPTGLSAVCRLLSSAQFAAANGGNEYLLGDLNPCLSPGIKLAGRFLDDPGKDADLVEADGFVTGGGG